MDALLRQLERLADALERPEVPIDLELWDAHEAAAYLRVSKRHFQERIAPHPKFPREIRIPSLAGGTTNPRWRAMEIIEWAEKQR